MEELFYATKETFADVLQEEDPCLFFQLRDENWGGLYVDIADGEEIPDKSVLKAILDMRHEQVTFCLRVSVLYLLRICSCARYLNLLVHFFIPRQENW